MVTVLAILWSSLFALISYSLLSLFFSTRLKAYNNLFNQKKEIKVKKENDEYREPFYERVVKPVFKILGKKTTKWTPLSLRLKEQHLLMMAGYPNKLTFNEWLAWRTLFWLFSIGIAIFLLLIFHNWFLRILLLFLGLMGGYILPILYLQQKKEERKKEIRSGLADNLDLLTVSMEAGLGFDAALSKVIEKGEGALVEELQKLVQEIRIGKSRREALKDLGIRTGVEELNSFATAIIQADQLGISLAKVLRVQAEDIREKRRQYAEEKAMKAPIKILFPLVFFIFPAIFIIILGPAVINIIETFSK